MRLKVPNSAPFPFWCNRYHPFKFGVFPDVLSSLVRQLCFKIGIPGKTNQMKSLFLSLALGIGTLAHASIITLDNNPVSPAMANNWGSAHAMASDGDTILVQATAFSYGDVSVSKRLNIFGPGRSTVGGTNRATFGVISLINGCDSTHISGIRASVIRQQCFNVANDIHISNCYLVGGTPVKAEGCDWSNMDNWVIEGCYIESAFCGGCTVFQMAADAENWLIRNNFIAGVDYGSPSYPGELFRSAPASTVISNNIFLIRTTEGVCNDCTGVQFTNNLYWFMYDTATDPDGTECVGCVHNHNLFYNPNNTLEEVEEGENNIYNLNPEFESIPGVNPWFNLDNDYHLSDISPGVGAGTGGTNIGVYGAEYNFRMHGFSNEIPRIDFAQPQYLVIPIDAEFNINIGAVRSGM